jgi:hypothetical protein
MFLKDIRERNRGFNSVEKYRRTFLVRELTITDSAPWCLDGNEFLRLIVLKAKKDDFEKWAREDDFR